MNDRHGISASSRSGSDNFIIELMDVQKHESCTVATAINCVITIVEDERFQGWRALICRATLRHRMRMVLALVLRCAKCRFDESRPEAIMIATTV